MSTDTRQGTPSGNRSRHRLTLAAFALLATLTACGGGDDRSSGATPFTGTWHGAGGAGTGAGGTTLRVDAAGKVTFKSTVDCTGTITPAGDLYRFAIDCRISRFTGTAPSPNGARTFTMTWTDGDTTEFQAAT